MAVLFKGVRVSFSQCGQIALFMDLLWWRDQFFGFHLLSQ
jgi:hypothetical protein